jgi:hypothetical protein
MNALNFINRKVKFDPSNEDHQRYALEYIRDHRWNPKCPGFLIELPFTNVPEMVLNKVATYFLEKQLEQNEAQ